MSALPLKSYYIEVRTYRRYSGYLEARSEREAKRLAREAWHHDELHTEEEGITRAYALEDVPK
jgi:hypothetical protein